MFKPLFEPTDKNSAMDTISLFSIMGRERVLSIWSIAKIIKEAMEQEEVESLVRELSNDESS